MIKNFVSIISQWTIEQNPIEEDVDIIKYGLEVLLENIVKYTLLIVLGALMSSLDDFIIVLVCFSILRLQAGGYHAKTNVGCFICQVALCILTVFLNRFFELSLLLFSIAYGVCILINIAIAPNGDLMCSLLDEKELKIKKYKSCIILKSAKEKGEKSI